MKKIIVCCLLIFTFSSCYGESIEDFVASLDAAWSQTNDVLTLQLINDRLANNSNDILAVSTKMYYYVFAEGNLTNARIQADQFMTIANTSTNVTLVSFAQEMRDEIYSIPLSEGGAFTEEEEAAIRDGDASFPFISKCIAVAKSIEE